SRVPTEVKPDIRCAVEEGSEVPCIIPVPWSPRYEFVHRFKERILNPFLCLMPDGKSCVLVFLKCYSFDSLKHTYDSLDCLDSFTPSLNFALGEDLKYTDWFYLSGDNRVALLTLSGSDWSLCSLPIRRARFRRRGPLFSLDVDTESGMKFEREGDESADLAAIRMSSLLGLEDGPMTPVCEVNDEKHSILRAAVSSTADASEPSE